MGKFEAKGVQELPLGLKPFVSARTAIHNISQNRTADVLQMNADLMGPAR
jgi:hypothetical protein